MPKFIDVILPIPLERLFTYRISEAEADFLKPGVRVAIPFGKSKIYTGIVWSIHDNEPRVYDAKDIHQILDEESIVNTVQLKLWKWIANYYMCTMGDVLRAALPSALLLESETLISKDTSNTVNDENLKDDEFLIYEALHHQSSLKVQDISNILDKKNVLPVLHRLINKKAITLQEEIYQKYKPKLERYVKLNEKYASDETLQQLLDIELSRARKQKEVILMLFSMTATSRKPVKVSELVRKSQTSSSIIRTLIDKKILDEYYIQTDRVAYSGDGKLVTKVLNDEQGTALDSIKKQFKSKDVVLLHGVTSSGKTEVYVKLIEEALERGEQALYLLPEIALTTQLISRLQSYFGEKVAVYHSRYSLNERVEVWNKVLEKSEGAQIVVGARSSIFLPFNDLGLVIVDEEHEQSYKQFDPAPRYHARDAAIVLAGLHKAKVLLGSATPSLETYHNCSQDKYGLVEMHSRFNNVQPPEVELVDLKEKYRKKRMKGHFSDRLLEEMELALEEDQQIILFQNRRGFSPVMECLTCGHSPQCPNCDVSLTYHQYKKQLRCHYCSYNMALQEQCQACGSQELDTKGFGTEQIEEEVKMLFPEHKVARMDLDTTRGKYAYEKLISSFEQQEIDILVGTQMLTKGLDFRHIKLVGIMNADAMLNFPDFRAHERSYQLMSQVAGRAGRTDKRGLVLIQTYNPYHRILQQVSTNDYEGMYNEQMNERHNYRYPPVYRLIRITLKHKDYNRVNMGADWLAKSLRQVFGKNVLGPEFPPIARIRNQYHKNVLVKIPKEQSLPKTKEAILRIKNSFHSVKDFRSIRLILNVDSY